MELAGQVALVTGSGRGIGSAIAAQLADAGADIALCSRTREQLEAVAEVIRAKGRRVLTIEADVSSSEQVETLVAKTVEELGRLDILVNNAGLTRDTLLLRMKEEDWDTVLNVNLKSAFLCTRAASKVMLRQKYGRIINITSVVGVMGNAGQANYAASKAGMIGFTKSVARELAARTITVNAVAPGYIETEMTGSLPDKVKTEILSQIPCNRLGTPEEVARMVGFLASPQSGYITGQVFHVDGGMVM